MRNRIVLLVSLGLMLVSHPAWLFTPPPASESSEPAQALFVENIGQFPAAARFRMYGGDHILWLTDTGLWLTLLQPDPITPAGVHLKVSFPNANPDARVESFNPQPTHFNYFRGEAARWRSYAPTWGGVRYVDLYPGVDLEMIGGPMLWRLVARPGAALDQVRLRIEGAEVITLEGEALRLRTSAGDVALPLLTIADRQTSPHPAAVVEHDVLQPFATRPLPAASHPYDFPAGLLYSTLLGGNGDDCQTQLVLASGSCGLTVNDAGQAYAVGDTQSSDFPTTPGAFDRTLSAPDAFVIKLNAAGTGLAFATFLGGQANEEGHDIALDWAGNIYVVGVTSSDDFPTTPGAYDRSLSLTDVFITKLNPSGSTLLYSTLLGGQLAEENPALVVDAGGQVFVTGATQSQGFPTTPGAFDRTKSPDARDAFVTKVNAAGSALVFSTFLGGSGQDRGYAIAVDNAGQAYVTGQTASGDFPTTPGAFDRSYAFTPCPDGAPCEDAFVVKFNSTGAGLVYGTYLGGLNGYAQGNAYDAGYAIAVDGEGNAHVAGETRSTDFPTTPGAYDREELGARDGFITKLNSAGTALLYSTFLGNNPEDAIWGMRLDQFGDVYVTGFTTSVIGQPFPTTLGAYAEADDPTLTCVYQGSEFTPCAQAFLSKLHLAGQGNTDLVYSTALGGIGQHDGAWSVALDGQGQAYVMGRTLSPVYPTTPGAFDTTYGGGSVGDAFIAKLIIATPTTPNTDTYVGTIPSVGALSGSLASVPIEYGNRGLTLANGAVLTATLSPALDYVDDDSGISPTVVGDTVVWLLPALSFPDRSNFNLRVDLPNAPLGTQYSVTWTITSPGVEFDPSNNMDTALVRVSLLTFLPLIRR